MGKYIFHTLYSLSLSFKQELSTRFQCYKVIAFKNIDDKVGRRHIKQHFVNMIGAYPYILIAIHIFLLNSVTRTMAIDKYCSSNDVHALILARGNSKGIPKKNLITIEGSSILARTINVIRSSGVFSCIWVSTDSSKIAEEGLKFGALVHRRPSFYALDETTSLDAVKEFLHEHHTINKFALFQCTSPFLKEKYILDAFQKFKTFDCVFSATRTFKLLWKNVGNTVLPINFDASSRPRRQSWNGQLEENGMFYFSSRRLIEQNIFQNNR